MSLVPTYVKMSNGNWYQNPVFYGDYWYICFDDDDPVELVIKQIKQLSKIERGSLVNSIIQKVGIHAKILSHHVSGNRLYPPDWKGFQQSINAFIEILKSPNSDKFKIKHDGVYLKCPKSQGVFYDWNRRKESSRDNS